METGLDAGTYDVLRDRLAGQARQLTERTTELNERRVAEFGATGLALTGTENLRTEQPSTARDVVAIGDILLFGRTARNSTGAEGVFTLHDRRTLKRLPDDAVPGLLDDPDFVRECSALHRYYRASELVQLRLVDGLLLAVFRTGEKASDTRVLRWKAGADGRAAFLDARGERDHVLPPAHDIEWTPATREDHVPGRHPHIAVPGGELYVATLGGTLTLKTDNDTETAEGIHSEPVDEPLQSLADAAVAHARVGPLILLRVRPYKETSDRHLVYNTLTRTVVRLDGIGQACRALPEGQGIVFPGGYCLAGGEHKTFEALDTKGLAYERTVRAPNGEDVLYVFRAPGADRTLLLPYNVIRTEVATPITCRGHALFGDGELLVLRSPIDDGPAHVHGLQRWTSPYVSDAHAAAQPPGEGPLARVGNGDLVRGISDCLSVARVAIDTTGTPTAAAYQALVAACTSAADRYHWLHDPQFGGLHRLLGEVRSTAGQVLTEFETVQILTRQAADALDSAAEHVTGLARRMRGEVPRGASEWFERLSELRNAQGRLLGLKDLRYADAERIDALGEELAADLAAVGQRAVTFLARPDAFAVHRERIEELTRNAEALASVAEADALHEELREFSDQLHTAADVVTGVDIADATVRTTVLERVTEALAGVNRARATLEARRRELNAREGRAEFAAEFALLGQAAAGALAAAATPAGCDDQLARILLQLEDLQSRFAESDGFLRDLDAKRTEIQEALTARKQSLIDERARRTERLAASAGRVLDTVARRAATLASPDEIHTYFASDPLVTKVDRSIAELRELGDQVRADELAGRLDAARQEAARALRDRTELYTDDGSGIRIGRHRFAVNTQPLDLTLVPHGDGMAFALTGTDYRAPVDDPAFAATHPYWDQHLASENAAVYRAEHLASRLLAEHGADALLAADDLPGLVRAAAEDAYDEGYERGVHDHDATLILTALLRLNAAAGTLRHTSAARAAAQIFWAHRVPSADREVLARRAASLARARDTFGLAPAIDDFRAELAARMDGDRAAAAYLFDELSHGSAAFVLSMGARTFLDKFRGSVDTSAYEADLAGVEDMPARRQLAEAWLHAYANSAGEGAYDLSEAVAVELCADLDRYDSDAELAATVTGLLGTHPRIEGRALAIRLDEFLGRTREFRDGTLPGYRNYRALRTRLAATERERLRLDEHRPRVMSTFVRGRLVDEVHLPLVGDNLSKQLGTAGGLLLLISPPGYGKTTLMEYVADRLGMMLVKVNGPALGHAVTSLDPAEAPNTTARQEIDKVNFALEAANNVLLYLDDIQHTSPELLQKFISLCDAQRRMEGVWNGVSRTYDLRGKRFAVCMAGNPYTESGARFRIPDMLANRADVRNLGDVLTGKEEIFALSFVENALTANPHLAPLAGRDRADLALLLRMAEGDPTARPDHLTHPYPTAERERIVAVLRHLLTARATVLAVNAAYIESAAQDPATRTEPPFQLQGSYRDMNAIATRIDPVMNEAELVAVIDDHYRAQAQTLTADAEANLLKLAVLRGTLTAEQSARWTDIKHGHVRARTLGGPEEDPATRAVAAIGLLAEQVASVESAITRATHPGHARPGP
ncbi:DNA repair ATPase [Streptomyces sp. NPDC051684]|uniref:DNA repair ATPase n=1 Tax=Streptomyces sp. NPDC051684 TaxID=3365670 RepID=UPI0037B9367F